MKKLLMVFVLVCISCSSGTNRQPYITYKGAPHEVIDEKGNIAPVKFTKSEAESICMDLRSNQVVDFDCVHARRNGLPYP